MATSYAEQTKVIVYNSATASGNSDKTDKHLVL